MAADSQQTSYEQALAQMRAGGLIVDSLDTTGRVVRCRVDGGGRERRGWYVLHEVAVAGGSRIVGTFGIWRGNDNGAQKIEAGRDEVSAEVLAAMRRRMREDRRRVKAQRQAEAQRAARRAEVAWRQALPEPPGGEVPEYLRRKGIQGHGVRYTERGAVVIAMHDADGRVHGLQFILSRPAHAERIAKTGRDKEYWPAGLSKQGRFFLLGAVRGLCLVAEGYATAASLHEATGLPVAVAFDAGNLAPVALALKKRYPRARYLICADDDFSTKGNPGQASASAAALEVGGAWVVPRFADERQVALRKQMQAVDWAAADHREQAGEILRRSGTRKATDFNDLHLAEGLLVVRGQIEARLALLAWSPDSAGVDTAAGGAGSGAQPGWVFDLERLIAGYSLIYSTDTVFDAERAMVVGLGPMRSACGKGLVRQWLEHPDRQTVMPDEVGFDPVGTDPRVRCNLWAGWPTQPAKGSCLRLLELAEYLCNSEPERQRELYQWLMRWIAYPIQHPGAKMQTSVLMHGPEGTGKNTLFGAVRRIYGRYGCQFSQVELESQFNGWASGKLFAIGNEVVSRAELYHIQGRLKSMITELEWVINEKMLPARMEQNHCNFVFFSNRIDIAKLDPGDRRYCVIWTPEALPSEIYREVSRELEYGGLAAFHQHLLELDLGDFSPHTKPPMTGAKEDLVELGMDSTERFYRDWIAGDIADLPAAVARSEDVYRAYRLWAQHEGIGKPAQKQTLLTALGKHPGARKVQERYRVPVGASSLATMEEKRTVIFVQHAANGPQDGESRADWIGRRVAQFAAALDDWQEGLRQ
jgi:putative DNA primase/helicase